LAFWSSWSVFGSGQSKRVPGVQRLEPSSGRMTKRQVTDETALQLSTVFACVRLLAETVAGLSLNFFKVSPDGTRVLATDYSLFRLLSFKPNRYQTRVEFWETIIFQLAFRGNAYCAIERNGTGEIISLMPLMTAQVNPVLQNDGSVIYEYSTTKGVAVFAEESIWHLKLFGNGITGLSPLDHARNSLGIAISAEDRVNVLANSGFKPSGVLMIDKILKKEQRDQIREAFKDLADGGDDTLRVLEAGMTYQQVSMNPKDVQLLESRKFQTEDIARFFGVPSVLINDTSGSTVWGSGISEIIRGFYKLGLRPYLERIECSLSVRLINIKDRMTIVPEWDFDMLLRGAEKERYEGYNVAVRSGVMTPNECRKLEGLSPDKNGGKLYIDRQLIFIENGGLSNEQVTTSQAQPAKS
jgi:HK97 family phage portal protein